MFSVGLAETANDDEMLLTCKNFLTYMTARNGGWGGSDNPTIASSQDVIESGLLVARYFEIEPSGYVLVPVLKEMPPVKAYSDIYRIDLEAHDGFGAMIREVLNHRTQNYLGLFGSLDHVQAEKSGEPRVGEEQIQMWAFYLQSEEQFQRQLQQKDLLAADDYGPLLTTTWHQSAPYNNDCPWGDGGRTVVGCVATATAQIMAYYQWPPQGTGTHAFYWNGDNSCGGSTAPQLLEVDFSDPYDWANVVNACGSCTPEQEAAVAELCYEVGVAFNMDYGRCGSGAYTADVQNVLPDHFRYLDIIEKHDRIDYNLVAYSDIIKTEIMAARPAQYRIYSHSIVCDGWREVGTEFQIHLNYGWGGGSNSWYVIDNLHCPWEGCTPMVEYVMTNIVPDRGVVLEADTTYGDVPFEVAFTGSSTLDVDNWIWSFGDDDSAFIQNPVHVYDQSGMFDVSLKVIAGIEERTYTAANLIVAFADTMKSAGIRGNPGDKIRLDISASNTVPVRKIKIPVEYSGSLVLTLDSFSTEGCRTAAMDSCRQIHADTWGHRSTITIENFSGTYYNLAPGSGPILSLFFTISPSATMSQSTTIELDGYMPHMPMFYTSLIDYTPVLSTGMVTLNFLCGDATADGLVNLVDILYLIENVYFDGPDPVPFVSGDVITDGVINLLDILAVIDALYGKGEELICY
jgi:hypothetical protein